VPQRRITLAQLLHKKCKENTIYRSNDVNMPLSREYP
jgi:hypothetical protein